MTKMLIFYSTGNLISKNTITTEVNSLLNYFLQILNSHLKIRQLQQ